MNSGEVYSGDIYTKGAFFMHTLRYVMGDTLFFPTLKKLATDPQYSYNNFVTTDDVEHLFSNALEKDLKPLFDFYLKTTHLLNIEIRQTGFQQYEIKSTNLPMPLPCDITADGGTKRIVLTDKWIKIKSSTPLLADPNGYYLKTVTTN